MPRRAARSQGLRGLTVFEYLVFVLPMWIAPPLILIGVLRPQQSPAWPSAPLGLLFLVATVAGLVATTRIAARRLRGEVGIGRLERFALIGAMLACCAPLLDVLLLEFVQGGTAPDGGRHLAASAFLWPLPVYAHWLASGWRAAR